MNWNWNLRGDGGMNGLEFARCLTTGGADRVLVHAAPTTLTVEVTTVEGGPIASGEAERDGDQTPMCELRLEDGDVTRRDIWPSEEHIGLPVLLAGGEVGILTAWHHAEDRSWWRWAIELSNHKDQPDDWTPPSAA